MKKLKQYLLYGVMFLFTTTGCTITQYKPQQVYTTYIPQKSTEQKASPSSSLLYSAKSLSAPQKKRLSHLNQLITSYNSNTTATDTSKKYSLATICKQLTKELKYPHLIQNQAILHYYLGKHLYALGCFTYNLNQTEVYFHKSLYQLKKSSLFGHNPSNQLSNKIKQQLTWIRKLNY